MKRKPAVFLAGCALLLTACAGRAASDPVPLSDQPEAQAAEVYEEPEYEVIPLTFSNLVRSEDENREELAQYSYQLVTLSVQNREEISPEDAEAADRNKEAFDSKMMALAEDLMEQGDMMADAAAEIYGECGSLVAAYEDDAAVDAVFCGDIVSASLHRSSYTGGAHSNSYETSYLFDLRSGQFIDPTQLAEDPEAFRTGVAELLLEKAEGYELDAREQMTRLWRGLLALPRDSGWERRPDRRSNNLRIKAMMEYIGAHYSEKLTLEEIAQAGCVSPRECGRSFQETLGASPFQYLTDFRLRRACRLLAHTDLSITEIAVSCGFGTSSYFSRTFRARFGQTPREYRRDQDTDNNQRRGGEQPHGEGGQEQKRL